MAKRLQQCVLVGLLLLTALLVPATSARGDDAKQDPSSQAKDESVIRELGMKSKET